MERKGVRGLAERDAAAERWLQDEVAKSYDAHLADPGSGIPAEKVMDKLRAAYGEQRGKSGNG